MRSRKAYIKLLYKQMLAWDKDISRLQKRATRMTSTGVKGYDDMMKTLRVQRKSAQKSMNRLYKTGNGVWGELRKGSGRSWREMRASVEKAVSRFA